MKVTVSEKGWDFDPEDGAKTKKEAISFMPFVPVKVVKVFGGWMGFDSLAEYENWKNQK
jgi:hypothetical protein